MSDATTARPVSAAQYVSPSMWVHHETVHARRAWAWGLGTSIGTTVIGLFGVLSQRDSLPAYVATAWNGKAVSATMSLPGFLALSCAEVLLVCLPMVVLAVRSGPGPRPMFTGIACGAAVFMAGSTFGAVLAQRGLAGPYDASNPVTAVLGSALMGGAIGVLAAWAVQDPTARIASADTEDDEPLFTETVVAARPVCLAIGVLTLVPILVLIVLGLAWWLVLPLVLLAALLGSLCMVRVTVDHHAVRALGLGVIPWVRVPLSVIAHAQATTELPEGVSMFGLRRRGRDLSVVVHVQEALVLTLVDGSTVTITTTRAAQAASLIDSSELRQSAQSAA